MNADHKVCTYCNQEKPIFEFPKHYATKDKLDSRCKQCKSKQNKILKEIKKLAPEKPAVCDCCKKPTDKWRCDHDHTTNKFRGWLCDNCNTGIGKLGDSLSSLMYAVRYLENTSN